MRVRVLAVIAASASCFASGVPVRADDGTHVVVARTGATATLVWNATPLVAQIVTTRAPDVLANDRLEHAALRDIAIAVRSLRGARTIAVRILYDKTGDVSPVYGGPTFAGVERYASMQFDAKRGRANADRWKGIRDSDPLPNWVAFRVFGTLPPR